MKTGIRIALLIMFLLIGFNSQAQFLKKLGKHAEKAAENAVLNRTEKEASQKTDQALDNVLNMDIGSIGGKKLDPATLPASYKFDWRYTLKMSHKKGDMNFHYYLPEEGDAFGSKPEMQQGATPMGNMFMVMDPSLKTTTILMENGGKKTGTIISNPDLEMAGYQESNMDDYEFKQIGSKKILGYNCQGFQMENEESKITMYIAMDAPVSFNNVYNGNSTNQLPKDFDPKWLDKIGENSLMMEMDFQNKKKPKQSAKMTCVGLEKEPLTVNITDYDFAF
ncbi:MAG: DUF4412 domain-containing protein [Pricia sp.]|nr:DUF4412 domain-containing protein [Pricia sp.]